jgi:hypothetical protein
VAQQQSRADAQLKAVFSRCKSKRHSVHSPTKLTYCIFATVRIKR